MSYDPAVKPLCVVVFCLDAQEKEAELDRIQLDEFYIKKIKYKYKQVWIELSEMERRTY